MTKNKSRIVGVRFSPDAWERMEKLFNMNPDVKISDFVRAAVNEKQERLESGEDEGIKLQLSPSPIASARRPKK